MTGIQLDLQEEDGNLFTVIIDHNGDLSPLIVEERILFFTDRSLLSEGLNLGAIDATQYVYDEEEIFTVYYALAIELLTNGGRDETAVILNLLNTFDDFLIGLKITIPSEFKSEIYSIANFLTFDKSLSDYFQESTEARARVIKSVQWCLGAILSKAKILQKREH